MSCPFPFKTHLLKPEAILEGPSTVNLNPSTLQNFLTTHVQKSDEDEFRNSDEDKQRLIQELEKAPETSPQDLPISFKQTISQILEKYTWDEYSEVVKLCLFVIYCSIDNDVEVFLKLTENERAYIKKLFRFSASKSFKASFELAQKQDIVTEFSKRIQNLASDYLNEATQLTTNNDQRKFMEWIDRKKDSAQVIIDQMRSIPRYSETLSGKVIKMRNLNPHGADDSDTYYLQIKWRNQTFTSRTQSKQSWTESSSSELFSLPSEEIVSDCDNDDGQVQVSLFKYTSGFFSSTTLLIGTASLPRSKLVPLSSTWPTTAADANILSPATLSSTALPNTSSTQPPSTAGGSSSEGKASPFSISASGSTLRGWIPIVLLPQFKTKSTPVPEVLIAFEYTFRWGPFHQPIKGFFGEVPIFSPDDYISHVYDPEYYLKHFRLLYLCFLREFGPQMLLTPERLPHEVPWLLRQFRKRFMIDESQEQMIALDFLVSEQFIVEPDYVERILYYLSILDDLLFDYFVPSSQTKYFDGIKQRLEELIRKYIGSYQQHLKPSTTEVPKETTTSSLSSFLITVNQERGSKNDTGVITLLIEVLSILHDCEIEDVFPKIYLSIQSVFAERISFLEVTDEAVDENLLIKGADFISYELKKDLTLFYHFPKGFKLFDIKVNYSYPIIRKLISEFYEKLDTKAKLEIGANNSLSPTDSPLTYKLFFKLKRFHAFLKGLIKFGALEMRTPLLEINQVFWFAVSGWLFRSGDILKKKAYDITGNSFGTIISGQLYNESLKEIAQGISDIFDAYYEVQVGDIKLAQRFLNIVRSIIENYIRGISEKFTGDFEDYVKHRKQLEAANFYNQIDFESCIKVNCVYALINFVKWMFHAGPRRKRRTNKSCDEDTHEYHEHEEEKDDHHDHGGDDGHEKKSDKKKDHHHKLDSQDLSQSMQEENLGGWVSAEGKEYHEKVINTHLKRVIDSLNDKRDALITRLAIRVNGPRIMQGAIDLVVESPPDVSGADSSSKSKQTRVLFDYLTQNMIILNDNLYSELFKNVLSEIFLLIVYQYQTMFFPGSANRNINWSILKPKTEKEARILVAHWPEIESYFRLNGNGLEMEWMENASQSLMSSLDKIEFPTKSLLNEFDRYEGIGDIPSKEKQGHLISLLMTRRETKAINFIENKIFSLHRDCAYLFFDWSKDDVFYSRFSCFWFQRLQVLQGRIYISDRNIAFGIPFWKHARVNISWRDVIHIRKKTFGHFGKCVILETITNSFYFGKFDDRKVVFEQLCQAYRRSSNSELPEIRQSVLSNEDFLPPLNPKSAVPGGGKAVGAVGAVGPRVMVEVASESSVGDKKRQLKEQKSQPQIWARGDRRALFMSGTNSTASSTTSTTTSTQPPPLALSGGPPDSSAPRQVASPMGTRGQLMFSSNWRGSPPATADAPILNVNTQEEAQTLKKLGLPTSESVIKSYSCSVRNEGGSERTTPGTLYLTQNFVGFTSSSASSTPSSPRMALIGSGRLNSSQKSHTSDNHQSQNVFSIPLKLIEHAVVVESYFGLQIIHKPDQNSAETKITEFDNFQNVDSVLKKLNLQRSQF